MADKLTIVYGAVEPEPQVGDMVEMSGVGLPFDQYEILPCTCRGYRCLTAKEAQDKSSCGLHVKLRGGTGPSAHRVAYKSGTGWNGDGKILFLSRAAKGTDQEAPAVEPNDDRDRELSVRFDRSAIEPVPAVGDVVILREAFGPMDAGARVKVGPCTCGGKKKTSLAEASKVSCGYHMLREDGTDLSWVIYREKTGWREKAGWCCTGALFVPDEAAAGTAVKMPVEPAGPVDFCRNPSHEPHVRMVEYGFGGRVSRYLYCDQCKAEVKV